ncbi:hypothetical protein STEG23_001618 [Scotinomys teguina]
MRFGRRYREMSSSSKFLAVRYLSERKTLIIQYIQNFSVGHQVESMDRISLDVYGQARPHQGTLQHHSPAQGPCSITVQHRDPAASQYSTGTRSITIQHEDPAASQSIMGNLEHHSPAWGPCSITVRVSFL